MRPEVRKSEAPQTTVKPLVVPEIVTFPAEVDITNARRFGLELIEASRAGASVVIADMFLTEFCDSSGVRYLLIGDDAARLHGAELRVVVSAPAILRMMN